MDDTDTFSGGNLTSFDFGAAGIADRKGSTTALTKYNLRNGHV